MAETFKFPGGNEITVVRKEDVIACIDDNILDKELALAVIEQCEKDCIEIIKECGAGGIPFIGVIKPTTSFNKLKTGEQKELMVKAKTQLTSKEYALFARKLAHQNKKEESYQLHYTAIVDRAKKKYKLQYKYWCRTKGELWAGLHFYFIKKVTPCFNIEEYAESSND